MRTRFLNRKVIAGLLILVVLFIAYQLFWYGRVSVVGVNNFTNVIIEDRQVDLSKLVKLRPGKYTVSARGPLIKSQDIEFSITPFGSKQITLPVEVLSQEELVNKVVAKNLRSNYQVGKTQLLENNTWLVALIFSPNGLLEGYTNIYKFNGREWELVISGTGFELEGYTDAGFPPSVIKYLGGDE